MLSPSILITDYMEIAGIGAAYFNSGIVLLSTLLFSQFCKARLTGVLVAGILTITGFSFFGKNLLNSIPLVIGVILYTKAQNLQIANLMHVACFSTGISPAVSLIMFGLGWPQSISIPLGILVGIIVGFTITPLSTSMLNFHQGYNLYNIGFTLGIIGLGIAGLIRMFDNQILALRLVYEGDDTVIVYSLVVFLIVVFIYGYYLNNGLKGYDNILKSPGRLVSDFVLENHRGLILINMALLGLICVAFIKISNGIINGPIIGGIFTVMGFGAFGKHPKNVVPILIGVYIASFFNMYDPSSTEAVLISLFGTTIAPVAGQFGFFAGIIAGFLHKSIATNVGVIHGGMNLYNNGLAGGFVAGLLVPLFQIIQERKEKYEQRTRES